MPADHESTPAILFDLIDMLERDRRSGARFELTHYLQRFPGHATAVAREYLRYSDAHLPGPVAALATGAEPASAGAAPAQGLPLPGVIESCAASLAEQLRRLAAPTLRGTRFRREEELARGGMGVVHRVTDLDLERTLAMKEMIRGPADHDLAAARFLEEAQVTAQLDHPGIVPIHEVGLNADGHLYFAMKLVRGRDLRTILELAREGREGWSLTRMLGVLLKVCEAMAYAHSKGVIHRDLKPGNVMVGHFGEVYVMDWGLARAMARKDLHDIRLEPGHDTDSLHTERREAREETPDSPLVTMDGTVVGTPAYMPPEQARGEIQLLSPRCDVYSIGAILYHLLTGHSPFVVPGSKVSARSVLWRVIEGPPPPVHALNRAAPAELVAICAKAMAREPAGRYRDMAEFAEDLRAYVERRVVRAYETGAWAELCKWIGRNKPLAASLATGVLALIAGLATSLVFAERARESEQRALAGEARARQETQRADAEAESAKKRTAEVLRLSALQDLDDLTVEADRLWPAHPENIRRYEAWLAQAAVLVAELPRHEASLAELAARARPRTAAELAAFRSEHARSSELDALQRELGFRRRLQAASLSAVPLEEPSAAELAKDPDVLVDTAAGLEARAWPLVDPQRQDYGAEGKGLFLARRALALAAGLEPAQRASIRSTFSWALFATGRFNEALAEAERAVAEADPARRPEFEELLARAQSALEQRLTPEGLEEEAKHLAELEQRVAELELEISSGPSVTFDTTEERWAHNQLEQLVAGLNALSRAVQAPPSAEASPERTWDVGKRLEFARAIRERSVTGSGAAAAWAKAIASIRDRAECPLYDGLGLTPQLGLFPIGRDPSSGLWEFAHLQSGEPAERGADGRLALEEQSGLTFVLIPGGTFWLGAQRAKPRAPNHDPQALPQEKPVQEVMLAPFFLSKYEMTQGQWLRFVGTNPSNSNPRDYDRTWNSKGLPGSLNHPVEQVDWHACQEAMTGLGLELPTEAQWEYAARAGTSSPWWTGEDERSLAEAANLADQYAKDHGGVMWGAFVAWDDGNADHAPVGSYRANAFGLHDVAGNVWEWCRDGFGPYDLPVRRGDGERLVLHPRQRVARGGGFNGTPSDTRSAFRDDVTPEARTYYLGLRPARSITP